MAPKTSSSHLFKSIIPFSQDHKSFYTRLAILSWDNAIFSNLLEAFLLIIEYAQLLSQAILLNLNLEQFGPTWNEFPLYNTILILAKIFNIGYFLEFQGETAITAVKVAIAITVLCLIKYCFIIYAVMTAARNTEGSKWLLRIYGLIFRAQGRVIYFFITSFWTRIILAVSKDQLDLTDGERAYLMTWSILMIIIEFILAFGSQAFFSYNLPSKSFLAAKSNKLELITLTQKLVFQICMISPIPKTLASAWVITLLNFAFSASRNAFFFQRLPYYKRKALSLQVVLQMSVVCLGITYVAHMILRSAYYGEKDINPNFSIICWIVITLLNLKVTFALVDRTFTQLLTSWQDFPAAILVHKIMAIKELVKNQHAPTKFVTNYKMRHLIHTTSHTNIANILNLSPEAMAGLKVDFESKQSLNELFLLYLENLLDLKPKECFVKLYLAYMYGKKLGIYGLSMTILVNLKKCNPGFASELNASLLINQMQQKMIHSHRLRASGEIDLFTYVKSTAKVAKLKEEIVKQADLQIKLCQEMSKDTSHIVKIYTLGWKIIRQRELVKQRSKRLYACIPKYFIELPALIAHYSLLLNYSLKTYLKFFKEYDLKAQKYKQSFSKDFLCQENVFDRDNLQVVLSGRREDLASVIYASQLCYEVYGRDIVGEKGFAVVNPSLHKFYQNILQDSLERGDPRLMGRACLAFQCHKEGYIQPSYFYLNLNPILSQDLYYMVIIRMVKTTNEYILLNEDGTIDACTKKLGYDLGILPKKASKSLAHISQLSKELNRVNQAFNMKAFPEKYENPISPPKTTGVTLNASQADNIYTIYTTEGKTIRIASLNKDTSPLWFNCKVENHMYGSILLKVVLLEKSEDNTSNHKVKPSHIKLTRIKFESKTVVVPTTPQDQSPVSPTNPEQSRKLDESGMELTDISRFTKEDEKEKGWIDFEKFQRTNDRAFTFTDRTPESKSKDRGPTQVTPTQITTLDVPPTSRRRLKEDLTTREQRTEPRLSIVMEEKIASVKEETAHVKIIELDNGVKHSRATQSSGVSVQIKITQVFHEAVKISYIPRFYQIFLLFWYALLTTILVNQFRLNLDGTSEMRASNYRKDIMMTSDLRTDSLVNVHVDARSLVDISNLEASDPDPDGDGGPALMILTYLAQELAALRGYNEGLMEAIGDFTDEFAKILFEKDIRMFEATSDQYTSLSSFQAVDRIVETGLKSLSIAQENLTNSLPELQIVLKNDLNDLLNKSYYTSHLLLMYSTESTQSKLDSFALSLILTIIGVSAMAVIFSILVYLQYKDDERNMLAFARIKKSGIKNLMKKIMEFKSTIQENANLEQRLDEDVIRCYHERLDNVKGSMNTSAKNSNFGSVDQKGTALRFYFYTFQTVILLGLITGLIAVNQITSKDSLKGNEQRLYKMNFANDVRLRVGLSLATALELMSNVSDPVNIVNLDPRTSLVLQMSQLIPLITQVPDMLKEPNGEYDPTIQEILFGDPCQYIDDDDVDLCDTVDGNGAGLIQRLSELESYINLILDQAPIIDNPDDFMDIGNRIVFMRAVFQVIFEVMNESFNQDIDADVFFNVLLNVIITLSLIIICIGVHMRIFRKVSESHNSFKSILETFPARLVLSNFVLKSYLSKTSRGVLDSIKEEI